jgi:hypothetical protein
MDSSCLDRQRSFRSCSVTRTVDPGCPSCPPGFRPLLRRNDFGPGLTNGESDIGGLDEFWLFCSNRHVKNSLPNQRTTPTG